MSQELMVGYYHFSNYIKPILVEILRKSRVLVQLGNPSWKGRGVTW